jgi:Spy/CpxP family protein refolding chaperone
MRAIICAVALTVVAPAAFADDSFAVSTMIQKGKLDQDSATRVQVIVDKYREKIDSLRHQDRELMRSMRVQLAATPANDKAVAHLSDQLLKNRAKLRDLRADRLSSIKKALQPAVFARLLLAMPQIDRALQKHAIELHSNPDS